MSMKVMYIYIYDINVGIAIIKHPLITINGLYKPSKIGGLSLLHPQNQWSYVDVDPHDEPLYEDHPWWYVTVITCKGAEYWQASEVRCFCKFPVFRNKENKHVSNINPQWISGLNQTQSPDFPGML